MSEGKKVKAFAQETVYDVLSCKEGSVYGNEYTENTAWTGSACVDAGRPELGMEYYQHFDDCFYTFDEVRFLGFSTTGTRRMKAGFTAMSSARWTRIST